MYLFCKFILKASETVYYVNKHDVFKIIVFQKTCLSCNDGLCIFYSFWFCWE